MKKGFTLIELLAVIIILGLIAVITVPMMSDIIASSKQKAYDEQVKFIIDASKNYSAQYSTEINTDPYYVSVDTLINKGFIDQNELINPKTKKKMDGCVKIKFDSMYNDYNYTYGRCQ